MQNKKSQPGSGPNRQWLNADLQLPVIVDSSTMDWQPSPSTTVWRKRLHLSGPIEAGLVTSVVRYEVGSSFHPHEHPDGEEIFVLEGVFSDEHGDWPAGTYLLNPEGFRHAPFSNDGCVLFVKLRQYSGVREHLCLRTDSVPWQATETARRSVKTLYQSPDFAESMQLERWDPSDTTQTIDNDGGLELFVLAGRLDRPQGPLGRGTWLRFPVGEPVCFTTASGCEFYLKRGHL